MIRKWSRAFVQLRWSWLALSVYELLSFRYASVLILFKGLAVEIYTSSKFSSLTCSAARHTAQGLLKINSWYHAASMAFSPEYSTWQWASILKIFKENSATPHSTLPMEYYSRREKELCQYTTAFPSWMYDSKTTTKDQVHIEKLKMNIKSFLFWVALLVGDKNKKKCISSVLAYA